MHRQQHGSLLLRLTRVLPVGVTMVILMDATNNHLNRGGPDMCAEVSHRRVRLQSRAVKLIGLLSAVVVAACAHTTEMSKAAPATPVPTPGSRAVTFEDLLRAPAPALCQHDPGNLVHGQLPPQEGHLGDVGIALNYKTAAYKVAFGDLTGRRRRRYGHRLQCRWGSVGVDCAALYGGPAARYRRAHAAGWNRPQRPYPQP